MELNYKTFFFLAALGIILTFARISAVGFVSEYGFFSGVFHGLTISISIIGNLFNSDIVVYGCENNGFFYNLGFIVGFAIIYRLTFLENNSQNVLHK